MESAFPFEEAPSGTQQNGQGRNFRPKLHRNQVAWTMLVQCQYAKPVHLTSQISEGQVEDLIEDLFANSKFPAANAHPAPQFTSALHVCTFCILLLQKFLSLNRVNSGSISQFV